MTIKEFILANYADRLNDSIAEEARLLYTLTYNYHIGIDEINIAIEELLAPPTAEEINLMLVAKLNETIDKYSLDVDKSLTKELKAAAIIAALYPIIEGGN